MPNAKPTLGPTIYRDALHLYLEFPAIPPASPCALRFDLTDQGLAKLMKHIPLIPSVGHVTGAGNLVADKLVRPKIARATAKRREAAKVTDAQRTSAAAIVRNLRSKI